MVAYRPGGDKGNSGCFEDNLPLACERRRRSGIDDLEAAIPTMSQKFVTLPLTFARSGMGELIEVGTAASGFHGFVSGAVSVVALGLYAFLQSRKENDDDDSNPGGGLMQPVS